MLPLNKTGLLVCLLAQIFLSCSEGDPKPEADTRSAEKDILSFQIVYGNNMQSPEVITTIDVNTGQISVSVPFDFDLTRVTQFPKVPDFATVVPAWGTEVNFNSPVTYVVTAQNETKKEYTVTINRREQEPLSLRTWQAQCEWDKVLTIYGRNFLKYRTDEAGNRIKNKIILTHQDTKEKTVFELYADSMRYEFGYMADILPIPVPEGFPLGNYDISAVVESAAAQSELSIEIVYPSPRIFEHPAAVKAGDAIVITGKYFTNIPIGVDNVPRLRFCKSRTLKSFYSEEFTIGSYSSTSIQATTKGFIEAEAYITEGQTRIQVFDHHRGYWVFEGDKEIVVTE